MTGPSQSWWLVAATALVLAIAALVAFSARVARRVEREVPPQGWFYTVEGAVIHAVSGGTAGGPTILMIHGLAGQLRHFTYALFPLLAARFRLIAIDRPGSGHSERFGDAGAGLRAQAAMIHEFLRREGIERPLVVGHSLGGAIALQLALDHPDSVGGLALLAPLTAPQRTPPVVFRGIAIASRTLRFVVAHTIAVPIAIRRRRAVLAMAFGPNPVPPDYPTRGGSLLGLRPAAFSATAADLLAAFHDLPALAARYESLQVPVGVFFGASDRILDPREHGVAFQSRLPEVDLELREGLGHMVQVSDPQAVARFIERMAARVAVPAAGPRRVA